MAQHNQYTFIGGMDFISPDVQIPDGAYKYLINARQRLGRIEPNNKPLAISNIPAGKKQGLIALNEVLIAFVAGSAYYNEDGSANWIKINGFTMSATVDRYYSIAVPAGNVTYIRSLNADENISSEIQRSYGITIQGTPAAILVQDGVTQPYIIERNVNTGLFSSRATSNYAAWNASNNREYVPIGKQMMIVDSKLFIVSADGHSVYQSISGRYLDFMVNVNTAGNKLATEAQGGAGSVSFNFDADEITAIVPTSVPSSFLYCTKKIVRVIQLDYTRRIFGEPTYFVATPIEVGVVNQESVFTILGDIGLIDFEGVKSFNAVQQLQNEGNNSIFSLQLAGLLKGKKQSICRAINFDNYALVNLDTNMGRLMAVYDMLSGKWIALDITKVGTVKQFAIVETESANKLYAINTNDELYQVFGDSDTEVPQLLTRSFISIVDGKTYTERSDILKVYFEDGSEEADVTVTSFVDGKQDQRKTIQMPQHLAGLQFPLSFPIIFSSEPTCEPLTFNFKGSLQGYKTAFVVQWSNNAKLQALELSTSNTSSALNKQQRERVAS